jgi:hypothetical protein
MENKLMGAMEVSWKSVGKYEPLTLSKTAVRKLAEGKNLPEDIEGVIGKFGGGETKSRCIYPRSDTTQPKDNRGLKVNDIVCYEDYGNDVKGVLTKVYQPSSTEKQQRYLVASLPSMTNFSTLPWTKVGVTVPITVSASAVRKIAEAVPLPEDIERMIGKYGGKKRRSTLRRKQKRRTTVKRR